MRSTGLAHFFDIIHQDPVISQVKLKWIMLRKALPLFRECDRNGLSVEVFEEKELICIQRVLGWEHLVGFVH